MLARRFASAGVAVSAAVAGQREGCLRCVGQIFVVGVLPRRLRLAGGGDRTKKEEEQILSRPQLGSDRGG